MRKIEVKKGDTYGYWTIIKEIEGPNIRRSFLCRCKCGIQKIVHLGSLRIGNSKSCGCYIKERVTRHGMSKTHPLYRAWEGIKQRTLNTKSKSYKNYGGRGIKVCKRWGKFENFRDDMLPTWEKGLEIDRIDNDGDYKPSNCRWVTHTENNRNTRRNKRYKNISMAEWAEKLKVPYYIIQSRLRYRKGNLNKALESFKTKPYRPKHSAQAPTDE